MMLTTAYPLSFVGAFLVVPNRINHAPILAAVMIAASSVALIGCGEETYKVSRGTDEIAKPAVSKPAVSKPAESKAAARIEKAEKIEAEILKKGKLR
jgi:hypothetical protein